ncbi:terminase large subunit domain-containing protein [Corynebacterium variabile]|uniref:terminase large subunit domain-containing protein n=1 Tax=Corynebacterium variabile TaxID=1727 RepID=UPI003FD2E57B
MADLDIADPRLELPPSLMQPRTQPVGEQLPQHFHAPEWTYSLGEDITDLAAVVGFDMLPWQQLVLNNAMAADPVTGRYQAFQVGLVVPRQNGKTAITRFRMLAGLFLFGERKIVYSAHLFKTAHSEFEEIREIVERTPWMMEQVRKINDSKETSIILKSGARMDFMSRTTKSGGRGLQGDLVIFDEAFALSGELVSSLLPTLSSRENPQVWYTSSTGFDYSETLLAVRKKAVEHPEDNHHLAYFEWSADPKLDWKSLEAVQQSNPSLGYLQAWSWIRETELGVMDEDSYRRERLGIWADASTDAAIGVELWGRSYADEGLLIGNKVKRRSLALEVTPDRDLAVLAGAAELASGQIVVDIIAAKPGVAWVQDVVGRIAKKHKPVAGVVIDSLSGTSSLAPRLAEAGVPVSLAKTRDVTDGTAAVFDGLSRVDDDGLPAPSLLHGEHPLLDDAAHTARRRLVGASKSAWTWQQLGEVRVEPLRAITLAVQGLNMEPVEPKKRGGRVA